MGSKGLGGKRSFPNSSFSDEKLEFNLFNFSNPNISGKGTILVNCKTNTLERY